MSPPGGRRRRKRLSSSALRTLVSAAVLLAPPPFWPVVLFCTTSTAGAQELPDASPHHAADLSVSRYLRGLERCWSAVRNAMTPVRDFGELDVLVGLYEFLGEHARSALTALDEIRVVAGGMGGDGDGAGSAVIGAEAPEGDLPSSMTVEHFATPPAPLLNYFQSRVGYFSLRVSRVLAMALSNVWSKRATTQGTVLGWSRSLLNPGIDLTPTRLLFFASQLDASGRRSRVPEVLTPSMGERISWRLERGDGEDEMPQAVMVSGGDEESGSAMRDACLFFSGGSTSSSAAAAPSSHEPIADFLLYVHDLLRGQHLSYQFIAIRSEKLLTEEATEDDDQMVKLVRKMLDTVYGETLAGELKRRFRASAPQCPVLGGPSAMGVARPAGGGSSGIGLRDGRTMPTNQWSEEDADFLALFSEETAAEKNDTAETSSSEEEERRASPSSSDGEETASKPSSGEILGVNSFYHADFSWCLQTDRRYSGTVEYVTPML